METPPCNESKTGKSSSLSAQNINIPFQRIIKLQKAGE